MRDRRDFLISTGIILGSVAFLETSRDAHAEEQQPLITLPSNQDSRTSNTDANGDIKTVIITGSNSGIGRASALQLASTGKFRVILACRSRAKADEAARELQKELSSSAEDATKLNPSFLSPSPFIPMECDLSSFKSIRAFVEDFHKLRLPLDALALNAGVQFSGSEIIQRSTDGYELTIATNHLGHFLLASLLLPDLEASSSSSFSSSSSIANGQKGAPRIVVTASEVHDPASPGGSVGKGAHLGSSQFPGLNPSIQSPMVDGGDWDADKAYKDSKLANVLFASELSRRLKASGSSVTVNSFGPGLITRTGFFRSQNPLFVGLFDFATNEIFKVAETVQGGGACLSFMISSPTLDGKSGLYFNNGISGYGGHSFVESGTSEESNDRKEAEALFEASKIAVGLA